MQGKSLYAILLSIIAVLALALAVLVIFLFTTFNNINRTPTAATETPAPTARVVPPAEQVEVNLYASADSASGDSVFNLKPSPAHEASYLMASISVVYDAGEKSKLLTERTALIDSSKSEFKQAAIEYFLGLTYEDLTGDPASMQKARDTLKDTFSGILAKSSKDNIILKIIIDKWNIQP